MAKFLDTQGLSNELNLIIDNAQEYLVIVSFSLKVHDKLQTRILNKLTEKGFKGLSIYYGNKEDSIAKERKKWIDKSDKIKLHYVPNLHSKCYLNESSAIITSMNLYDYSQVNNYELGIVINKIEDESIFNALIKEIKMYKASSKSKSSNYVEFDFDVCLKYALLCNLRDHIARINRCGKGNILSNKEVLILANLKDKKSMLTNLPFDKRDLFKYELDEILEAVRTSEYYKVIRTKHQPYENCDEVELENCRDNSKDVYRTQNELPEKGSIIATRINRIYLNDYVDITRVMSEIKFIK